MSDGLKAIVVDYDWDAFLTIDHTKSEMPVDLRLYWL